jgi:AcrR family transcriptional regulator
MKTRENPRVQQINQTAMALFYKFGFRRVSVEEICREANVSKMTFYKYYKNKTDLVKQLLISIFEDAKQQYRFIMDQDIPYEEKVKQFTVWKIEQAAKVSNEFIKEILNYPDPKVSELCFKVRNDNLQMAKEDFSLAQQNGDIRKEIKPEFILYFINHMIEMIEDQRLTDLYESPKELTSELMNFFFYGILNQNRG